VTPSPLDALAAELGNDMARIKRDVSGAVAEMRTQVAERLAAIRDGEPGPPGPPGEPAQQHAPDELAPLIGRAIALLAEAPPLVRAPPAIPAPVVNVTVPPAPPPRIERSRVKHDEHGRIVEIERDVA